MSSKHDVDLTVPGVLVSFINPVVGQVNGEYWPGENVDVAPDQTGALIVVEHEVVMGGYAPGVWTAFEYNFIEEGTDGEEPA